MFDNIDKILNTKKIRYEIMNKKLSPFMKEINKKSTVNVFIDIPSTIKQLYNPENIKGLPVKLKKSERYAIASNILNMVGHYRHYFASRWSCYSNIYFMYNSKIDTELSLMNRNYNKTYYEKRLLLNNPVFGDINTVIKDNLKVVSKMCEYIPHAYFIDTGDIDYRCIFNYVISNIDNVYRENEDEEYDEINIILTTNKDFYQSVLYDNTLILQPKGENTNIITYNKVIKELAGKSKTIEKNPELLDIRPENILLIDSIINHPDHDIEGIRNYSYLKAIKFLNSNNIDLDCLIENKDSLDELFEGTLLKEELELVKINFNIFNNQTLMIRNENKLNLLMEKCLQHKENPQEVRKVNEVYFAKYPLQTDYMWEGE